MKVGMFSSLRGGPQRFEESRKKYGDAFEFVDLPCPPTPENAERLKGCEAFLFSPFKNDGDLFWKKVSEAGVKYVVTCSAGYDHFDLEAMKKYGLKAANVPSYSPNAVAEHTVMLLLASLRKLRRQLSNIEHYDMELDGLMGREVRNQIIGVVGAGHIGAVTLEILKGFGPKKLYAYSPHRRARIGELAEYASLEEIYEKCDVILFHCALNDENYHMVNTETIARMKPGVLLVNTARGKLFDAWAVLEGLESGQLGAVAMDVIEGEEILRRPQGQNDLPVLDRLLAHDNFLFTMHTAFYTDEADRNMADTTLANLNEYRTTGSCRNELVK
ncbi:MAG: NAD(P)-dependent oxidoreductase [Eubacteriales bacterium]|nr:NAD(P)-dependent oxidoreductase [Eubacteriales bacterium]